MKSTSYYFITASVICSLLFFGCNKKPFDYRNKVWGEWDFHYNTYSWTFNTGVYNQQIGDFKGMITYDRKDKSGNTILVNYMDGTTTQLELTKQGNLECCGGSGNIKDNKTISFSTATNFCNFAMGGGTNIYVTGKKIE